MKPECKYGASCERKNPEHHLHFSHPPQTQDSSRILKSDGEGSSVACGGQVSEKCNSKNVLLILIGLPGSGKSTFCTRLMQSDSLSWKRICQDIISNGKQGSKEQCLKHANIALKGGFNVIIDRCNLTKKQRHEFIELGKRFQVRVEALILDFPVKECIKRAMQRTNHEGGLQGKGAPAAVQRMAKDIEKPSQMEGFSSIYTCQTDDEVEKAFNVYKSFSKTIDQIENASDTRDESTKVFNYGEENAGTSTSAEGSRNLAFPSISTSDFQFDHERAAQIIVETASEFLQTPRKYKLKLVMVDLKDDSDMLVRVRQKAPAFGLKPEEFLTVAGDITKLRSNNKLNCNYITNAANWRLKPGGGGVNAAIYRAAGDELEVETKKRAKTLNPGSALVVPLPKTSPLYTNEGVTHVIHVLGPNMNPQRPNCLQGDYEKGSKILRETYTCMFRAFASNVEEAEMERSVGQLSELSGTTTTDAAMNKPVNAFAILMQSAKRKFVGAGSDQKEKICKVNEDAALGVLDNKVSASDKCGSNLNSGENEKIISTPKSSGNVKVFEGESHKLGTQSGNGGMKEKKKWEPWADALRKMALQPENHKDTILQENEHAFIIADKFPKGRKHFLVISKQDGLDSIKDLKGSDLKLIQEMHEMGEQWIRSLLGEDSTLVFRMGYHSEPSMRQLHLHVISQDFDSPSLKNKKHWNSFTSIFFRDSKGVIDELKSTGHVEPCGDKSTLLKLELRCHRCCSVQPNIPRLKQHIRLCNAPFPNDLVQKGYIIMNK